MIKAPAKFFVIVMLFSWLPSVPAHAEGDYIKHPKEYSVEEAYAFFGHERVAYNPSASPIPENEKRYLEHLFYVADMATQARVNMMQYYFAGTQAHKKQLPNYLKIMEEIKESFTFARAPTKDLREVEELFLLALAEQRDFFIYWSKAQGPNFISLRKKFKNHELVQSSHIKLQRIYTQLMLIYPDETPHNQKAFYSHLCALDFI